MTDNRFCRKVIEEARVNLIKTEQALGLSLEQHINGLYMPYSKKSYKRIERLLDEINNMCNDMYIELTDDLRREIHIVRK